MNFLFFQLQHRWCLRANLSSSLKIKHENRNQRQAESMYKFDIKVYRIIKLFVKILDDPRERQKRGQRDLLRMVMLFSIELTGQQELSLYLFISNGT